MILIYKLVIILLALIIFPVITAHLNAGEDKVVNGYLIDFGYAPEELNENENVVLAFNFFNGTTNEALKPTKVWIRISIGDKIVFAGTFYPEIENVAFGYTFPEAGHYEITARFYEVQKVLTETDFFLEVGKHRHESEFFIGDSNLLLISSILNIVFLIVIIFPIKKHKK